MSSPAKSTKKGPFPVGVAGKRELKRALKNAKGLGVIKEFQQSHSLHSMMALAFETTPNYKMSATTRSKGKETIESLDTDAVIDFLSHLGVSHYEVHKRISDNLLKQLEDEIRKTTNDDQPLIDLLLEAWIYAVALPELRPIIWAILRQLSEKTPTVVLKALAERDEKDEGTLKHKEIYQPLPPLLKKLVWEEDWTERFPLEQDMEPAAFLEKASSTILYKTIYPFVEKYCTNKILVTSANIPFVSSVSDRRVVTTRRRALTSSTASQSATTVSLMRGGPTPAKSEDPTSGKAIAQLYVYLTDVSSSKSVFRPQLLHALFSILIAQHGTVKETFLGGANFLPCTLVADILLSAGGPLPKAYQHVHSLARCIDECVQEGNVSDDAILKIQKLIRHIFQPDTAADEISETAPKIKEADAAEDSLTTATRRQLNRIVKEGIATLKEADPQALFLNPVTDAIAPGYSRIIKKPMCISKMEEKVFNNEYNSVADWEQDVKLMFKNCIDYNRGESGAWFRGEAMRQGKVFREEIFPQARSLYQNEIVKRKHEAVSSRKRAVEDALDLHPLPSSVKKRKKDRDELSPSMPALASMVLSDPFWVRIVLARILKELRQGVVSAESLPVAHRAVPSLLQFLHLARFSTQVCASWGKRFVVPGGGVDPVDEVDNAVHFVPFATLRNDLPLLLRLLVEAELDKRMVAGEDLHEAAKANSDLQPPPIDPSLWVVGENMEVVVSLLEGALVHLCQPGNSNESSLGLTFGRFAKSLLLVARECLQHHRVFFQSLIRGILRHKAKLTKPTRDAIVNSWLGWLRSFQKDCASSAAHECFLLLLNEWSSIGNLVLPRDTLLDFCQQGLTAVKEAEGEEFSFPSIWRSEEKSGFADVKKQYLRMLKTLPSSIAKEWMQEVGIADDEEELAGDHDAPALDSE